MKTVFIKDIKENQKVASTFLVKQKNISRTKAGKPFLNLTLSDKTGEVIGRVWENAETLAQRFQKDDFISLESTSVTYQNALQLNISALTRCPPSGIDITDYLPEAERDRDELFDELKAIIENINNPYLKHLLDLFLQDQVFVNLFKSAPAAKKLHHVYIGGLLEHTVSVANLILKIGTHYGSLNLDLLLTAGILHDIGKVHELTFSYSFDYSDAGRLLGHIVIGLEMITEKINSLPDFPVDLAIELKHLIISHHGQYDYGSPKRPKTLEAFILFYLDDLDAKVNDLRSFTGIETDNHSRCAGYHKTLDRYIFKSLEAQDPLEPVEEED
ncbi:MAG: HD domain-containing protein [Thermodesulfobacteriota bacterium]|nr:HD domain-containing protein [Thermodesulfobacteriota bacterium]